MPLLLHTIGRSQRSGVLTQTIGASPPAYDTATSEGENRFTLARLNGQWNRRLDAGGRLEWKLGVGQGRFDGSTRREEATAGALTRMLDDRNEFVDRNLLAEGKSVFYTVSALFGGLPQEGSAAFVGNGRIMVLQFAILALGLAGSLYTARRIAHRRYRTPARRRSTLIPFTILITVLAALNVAMFLFPMAHRM